MILRSGLAYGLTIFAVGFVFGTIRVLWLLPRVGEGTAVLLELPLMLIAVFLLARWAVRRWQVAALLGPRLTMGAVGFGVLMVCEVILSLTLFGNTLAEHLAQYRAPVALIGLAGQMVVVGMPALLLVSQRPQ